MGWVTDQQVRKLNEEMAKRGEVGLAAMRAGMDRKAAQKTKDMLGPFSIRLVEVATLPEALRWLREKVGGGA